MCIPHHPIPPFIQVAVAELMPAGPATSKAHAAAHYPEPHSHANCCPKLPPPKVNPKRTKPHPEPHLASGTQPPRLRLLSRHHRRACRGGVCGRALPLTSRCDLPRAITLRIRRLGPLRHCRARILSRHSYTVWRVFVSGLLTTSVLLRECLRRVYLLHVCLPRVYLPRVYLPLLYLLRV